MTSDQSLRLFEIVNKYFNNNEDSKAFVSEIDKLVTERSKEEARNSATKEDLSTAKIDLIKWMFGFWITLVLLILANWFLKH